MKLTKKKIEDFKFEGATPHTQDIRWDEELQGFGVRVFPTNAKSFVIHYRSRGRQRLFTIGKVGILTLDEARAKARKDLAHRNETDPAERHRTFIKAPTFGDLAKIYLDDHASKKRSAKDDRRRITKRLLPKWSARKLDAITHHDVQNLHRTIGAEILHRTNGNRPKHYEANRTLALVRVMFNKAIAWGMLSNQYRNPAIGVTPFEEFERERWIRDDEMNAIAKAIQEIKSPYPKGAIWLAFLTGMRVDEVLKARWDQYDASTQTLTLPTTKNRRPHVVGLTREAIAVIEAMPKIDGNPHIFCGRVKGSPLTTIKSPWKNVKNTAGIPDINIHDIRRTVGSWLAQQGESIAVIKSLLNHRDIRTTLRYTRSAKAVEIKALETNSRKLRSMIGNMHPTKSKTQEESGKRKIRLKRPERTETA